MKPERPRSRALPRKQKSTVKLRRLAAELRRLRAEADLTQEQVVERTHINAVTLYRVERAHTRPQKRTLLTLLDLYEVGESTRTELLELNRAAASTGWLQPYHSELPENYTAYIEFENAAREVRNYQSLIIPGLLQTEDYARAYVVGVLPTADTEEVERQVLARLDRQSVLSRDTPLRLWAIVDEAVIRRVVGDRVIMQAQLRHLVEFGSKPHVTLQVVPFEAGAHPGMPGTFVCMDFPDPAADPPLVYLESMAGNLFLEDEPDIQRFNSMFDHLRAVALSPDDSMALISKVAGTTS